MIIDFTETFEYMDDRLGFISNYDEAYTMDDFGTLVWVPFSIPSWYWQVH